MGVRQVAAEGQESAQKQQATGTASNRLKHQKYCEVHCRWSATIGGDNSQTAAQRSSIMRIFSLFVCVFASSVFSAQAFADINSYCEVFAQDFASGKTSDVDKWQINYRNVLRDCMTQYTVDAKIERPNKKVVEKVVKKAIRKVVVMQAMAMAKKKRTPILEPGSNAWNSYCAAKYASFDKATGNFKSYAGKAKPCLVPSH